MQTSHTLSQYDPNRLLDALLAWLHVEGDKALSRKLQLSVKVLHNIRAGRVPVRHCLLVQMAECAGKSLDELRRILGERRRKTRLAFSMVR
jgi:hypothetical protein